MQLSEKTQERLRKRKQTITEFSRIMIKILDQLVTLSTITIKWLFDVDKLVCLEWVELYETFFFISDHFDRFCSFLDSKKCTYFIDIEGLTRHNGQDHQEQHVLHTPSTPLSSKPGLQTYWLILKVPYFNVGANKNTFSIHIPSIILFH